MTDFKKIKRRFKASFLCLIGAVLILGVVGTTSATASTATQPKTKKVTKTSNSAKTPASSFQKPDFAFPQNVSAVAAKEFSKAMREGDGLTALKAAIQLNVASTLISKDSYPESLARYDSIANTFGIPWSNLANMLKANLYSEIYSSDSYNFSRRQLPLTPRPANVLEWSKPMFAAEVRTLVEKALENQELLASEPLSKIADILTDTRDAEQAGFTVCDFLTLQAMDCLSQFGSSSPEEVIPFDAASTEVGKAESEDITGLTLLDAAISQAQKEDNLRKLSIWCRFKCDQLRGDERKVYLAECLDRFTATPYCAEFIVDYCGTLPNDNDGRRNQLRLLDDYKSRFPKAPNIGLVENAARQLKNDEVNITFADQLLPGKANQVRVDGANLYNFNILVVELKSKGFSESYRYSDLASGKVVATVPVHIPGSVPDAYKDTVTIPSLDPGVYALVASSSTSLRDRFIKATDSYLSTLRVSGISVITVANQNNKKLVYVVSGENQEPVAGAKVNLYNRHRTGRNFLKSVLTDSEGKVELANSNIDYEVETNQGRAYGQLYQNNGAKENKEEQLKVNVLTDLSLYRPGAEVAFSAIAYTQKERELSMAPERQIMVALRDANWQEIDTVTLVTDRFGRADGKFRIPDKGLAGYWGLIISSGNTILGETSFQIAEYNAPLFYADVKSSDASYTAGDTIVFRGEAKTYAGMPVADGKVSYTVSWMPGWWRGYQGDATYGGKVTTNADGSFEIRLATEALKNTGFEKGVFLLKGEVTDANGESQQFPSLRFAIGDGDRLTANLPNMICADNPPASMKVRVTDFIGNNIVRKVYYTVSADGKVCQSGSFESPAFNPDISSLPSGKYDFTFSLNEDMKESDDTKTVTYSVVIWRQNDRKPPIVTSLWVPETRVVTPRGAKTAEILLGSSLTPGYILAIVSDQNGFRYSKWVKLSDQNTTFEVEAPADEERIFVDFIGESNLKIESQRVTVIPYSQTEELIIKTITWRDRIVPGAQEKFKFGFSMSEKNLADLPAFAVMTDKSLNALEPFAWTLNPYSQLYWRSKARINYDRYYYQSSYYSALINYIKSDPNFMSPAFNSYGRPLYDNHGFYLRGAGYMTRSTMDRNVMSQDGADDAVMVAEAAPVYNMSMKMAAKVESASDAAMVDEQAALTGDGGAAMDNEVVYRELNQPVAFFMPGLVTNKDGEVEVEFTAPDFVGTWQFQIAAYTPDMRGAVLKLDAVSAKTVMAQMNAPRFVRTGDNVSLSANVYNNSGEKAEIGGRIEILNALTGEVLCSQNFEPTDVQAEGARLITVSYKVPMNVEALTLRVSGTEGTHTDGEQTTVPVLPATSVVNEATSFYLGIDSRTVAKKLPVFDDEASVTLSFTANPIWDCLTALPALSSSSESKSILSIVSGLFGNAVTSGLLQKYPALMEGLREMAAVENVKDSALVSPLQKNGELKNLLLSETPWVQSAATETLRMQSLIKYADVKAAHDSIEAAVKLLADRQNDDGSWSWCPGMEPSVYMTNRVMGVLGDLNNLGYLPESAVSVAHKAISYLDKEYVKDWEKSKRKYYPEAGMLQYLYARSSFNNLQNPSGFAPLHSVFKKDLLKKWKNMSLYAKATAALVLQREGEGKTARLILESLRQYASVSPEKGMWFDNLESGYGSCGALLTTARVLEAFSEIAPDDEAIDKLRQWIVLSKQTQDWHAARNATEAICAVLSSGTDWNTNAAKPEIRLNGRLLEIPESSRLIGAFNMALSAAEASGAEIEITLGGTVPAWGGVVARYVAPIAETKAVSMPELSVSKAVYALAPTADGIEVSEGSLKTGDRVRVTLTVKCDRDLDYVAITDNRAACLEPVDQLSGYTSSDGVWYYREVKTAVTNFFIGRLRKGTHVLSYDCFVDRPGDYSLGIVSAQSQYAPVINASSAGAELTVSPQP